MKSPLRYQISDYDCGPTSMLNAVSFLFEREQIPPELIRNIMLFSLDAFSPDGAFGKSGTSCTAMMFLSNWLSGLDKRDGCRSSPSITPAIGYIWVSKALLQTPSIGAAPWWCACF